MSPRTGRPPSDNPKNLRINLRISQKTADLLEECAEKMHTSRVQVVERGLELVKAELDKK
jgi:uncharacterized protein (DUF1778 family)